MRMTGLSLALVVLAQAACLAETPELSGPSQPAGLFSRGRMFSGQNWWTRFGEPVNAAALAAEGAKGDVAPASAAMYGHDYIYGPGSCDCPPPCIDHLWSDYEQHPKRCDPYVPLFHRLCGKNCCDDGCGHGCGDACPSCATKAACGCAEPVSCSNAVDSCCEPICGKKRCHLGHKWKGCLAHWNHKCDSCCAPLACGCATPVGPAVQMPSEKQALARPSPLPDDAALIELPRIN